MSMKTMPPSPVKTADYHGGGGGAKEEEENGPAIAKYAFSLNIQQRGGGRPTSRLEKKIQSTICTKDEDGVAGIEVSIIFRNRYGELIAKKKFTDTAETTSYFLSVVLLLNHVARRKKRRRRRTRTDECISRPTFEA